MQIAINYKLIKYLWRDKIHLPLTNENKVLLIKQLIRQNFKDKSIA